MRACWWAAVGVGMLLAIAGCGPKSLVRFPIGPPEQPDYNRPLPPGQLALRKITDPAEIPDFSGAFGDWQLLREAVRNSLEYLSRPSSRRFFPYGEITHEQAVASLQEFLVVLDQAGTGQRFNELLRERFDVYVSVGCDDQGTVLFTGYYCPIFDARLQRDAQFRYPLYRAPADLVRDAALGETMGRRKPDGQIVPYYPRGQIEGSNVLAGNELLFLADRFEAYVVTVQGSGKLRLPGGEAMEIGFAGDNGYDYASVAEVLVAEGKIKPEELSLDAMIAYFRQHPDQLDKYLPRNPRYVFFKPVSGGPYGCLNVRVLPMRSVATDKQIYPRACLAYLQTKVPRAEGGPIRMVPYTGFALDQDRGNAIRAAGRCDIFMGTGPEAGRIAGTTRAEGKLYYLFVKTVGPRMPVAQPQAPEPTGATGQGQGS